MKTKLAVGAVCMSAMLLLSAAAASANVIPGNPRVGDSASTRMWCFNGTATFTIVGPGVSVVVGTGVGSPNTGGMASTTFIVPDIAPGSYTMVGKGKGCDAPSIEVRVPFSVRSKPGKGPKDPKYPPPGCKSEMDLASAAPGSKASIKTNCFPKKVKFTFGPSSLALGSADADAAGVANLSFTVPDVPNGDYVIGASGVDPDGNPIAVSTVLGVLGSSVAKSDAVSVRVLERAPVAAPASDDTNGPSKVIAPATVAPSTNAKSNGATSSNGTKTKSATAPQSGGLVVASSDATTNASGIPAVRVLGISETAAGPASQSSVTPPAAASSLTDGFVGESESGSMSLVRLTLLAAAAGGGGLMFVGYRRRAGSGV